MFRRLKDPRNYGWMFQGSPAKLLYQADGPTIASAIESAHLHPLRRPIDKKAARPKPRGPHAEEFMALTGDVVIPEQDPLPKSEERAHNEMQYLLLKLGNDLGLDVWVARNDRSRSWNGHDFKDIAHLRSVLPEQFDRDTQKIVELIDVLWLERDGIRCAFEIENSTNIYGGLLRMSDLLSRRPNLDIPLYIVAPDERQAKVVQELNRPTFIDMRKPLVEVCKFIPYSALRESVARWSDHVRYLKPDVIDGIAISCRID